MFIFVLHILAFFEYPSSLTLSSDIRFRGDGVSIPCGVTEGIELICLLFFVMDVIIKVRFEIPLKALILKSHIQTKQCSIEKIVDFRRSSQYVYTFLQYWLIGFAQFRKKNWMIATVVVLTLSLIDWCVSIGFRCNEVSMLTY